MALLRNLAPFFAGLLFSSGLIVSGMINPEKVLGFLDIFGAWDPSLAFVMGGAVAVNLIAFHLTMRRAQPFFERQFWTPTKNAIDRELVLGASVFGVGWGLVGLCPGPAIAALGAGDESAAIFAAAMLAGMVFGRWAKGRAAPAAPEAT